MMKRILSSMFVMLICAFAGEYLVDVELTEERLSTLAQTGVRILAELENSAVVLLDDVDFERISMFKYRILDTPSVTDDYYIVRPMKGGTDLTLFGDILTRDGDDYVINVQTDMLESLIDQRVMLKHLSFTPMVIRSGTEFPPVRYNQTVADIVSLISADSILANVQRLQDFRTRLSTHDSCMAAANWIRDKFLAIGCDTVYFQYHTTGHAPNVIAVKDGTVYPDSIYGIICGHFDSFAFSSPELAPGADDNASGTSAVIEAARVMRNYDFEYSVRYIAFSGEEMGLYGSEYYAENARSQGDSIIGVINGDMIAYVDLQPESLEVIAKPTNPACGPFADFFAAVADTYTTLETTIQLSTTMIYSDHSPFWNQGYVALCNIEDWPTNTPYVHTPGDSIGAGFNDLAFCTDATRAEIAALAVLAIPVGTGIDELIAAGSENIGLTIRPTVGRALFTISLMSQSSNPANLTIHDVAGRVVKNISLPASEAGQQVSALWDGTDDAGKQLPAGIYLVTAADRALSATAKLVMLR
ncbi:MAG: M28 family peptidase [candidate division WOR-3 bacterium]|nr:MAG: M28 family peptidase [candidate division WOR-3 bacterium]